LNPEVDARRIAPYGQGRVAAVEVFRVRLVNGAGLVVIPIRWRLGCERKAPRHELAVEMEPYQILEVTPAHDISPLSSLGLPDPEARRSLLLRIALTIQPPNKAASPSS
jgi:hypothetical protein